jgi:hypothetical protein
MSGFDHRYLAVTQLDIASPRPCEVEIFLCYPLPSRFHPTATVGNFVLRGPVLYHGGFRSMGPISPVHH